VGRTSPHISYFTKYYDRRRNLCGGIQIEMAIRLSANKLVKPDIGEYLAKLKPEVLEWLELYDIEYELLHEEVIQRINATSFITVSYTIYFLEFKTDSDAVLFKMEWPDDTV
jgi:hypothetical protein